MDIARRFPVILLIAGCLAACQPITPAGQENSAGNETAYETTTDIPIEVEVETAVEAPSEAAVGEEAARANGSAEADAPEPDALTETPEGETMMEPGNGSDEQELIALGMDVYRENYCGVCHRLAAVGTTGAFGPPHDEMGRVAIERIASPAYGGAATDAAGYIWESIVDPYVYLVPTYEVTQHRMPPYAHLADEQIDALVAMLLAQE